MNAGRKAHAAEVDGLCALIQAAKAEADSLCEQVAAANEALAVANGEAAAAKRPWLRPRRSWWPPSATPPRWRAELLPRLAAEFHETRVKLREEGLRALEEELRALKERERAVAKEKLEAMAAAEQQ